MYFDENGHVQKKAHRLIRKKEKCVRQAFPPVNSARVPMRISMSSTIHYIDYYILLFFINIIYIDSQAIFLLIAVFPNRMNTLRENAEYKFVP